MADKTEKIVRTAQIPYTAPFEQRSYLPPLHPGRSSTSSIDRSKEIAPAFQSSKPLLDPPLSIWNTIHLTNRLEGVTDRLATHRERRINLGSDKISKLYQEEALKLEEAYGASKNVTFWGILEDIGSSIMGCVSFFYGAAAVSSGGTAVGGMLIASGVLSVTNIAFKHARVWDWIAEQLAQGNQELRQSIATYVPSAVGLIAIAMGATGAYRAWQYSHLPAVEQALSIVTSVAVVTQGLVTLGKSMSDAHLISTQAQISALQTISQITTIDLENMVEDLKFFQKNLIQTQEFAAKLIQDTDQIIQSTQQPV